MDPYDPDHALEAIRPRLAAARARRRRAVGVSSAAVLLGVSSVAAASVMAPTDEPAAVVAVSSADGERPAGPDGPEALTVTSSTTKPPTTTTTTKPPTTTTTTKPPTTTTTTKPPTTTTTKPPTTTTTTKPAQEPVTHTFTYPGTGSVTVTQTGDTLRFVDASAESGWSHRLSHDHHDLIGVEFTKDGVQRWLKVKVIDGVAVAERHEQVSCLPPPGTSTHEAPDGAGTMTVEVGDTGKLFFAGAAASEGWTAELLEEKHDLVKVRFKQDDGHSVWVKVLVHDCTLKVETG
ncbi:MAG: hypothetical protein ACLFRV_05645 [Acidimicrobiales bacterium]